MDQFTTTSKLKHIEHLVAHLRVPLYRNGYLLMLNAVATSGLGVAYWMLAARFYSAEVIGLNSALLAALTLLSGIGQLSLNGALVRFVPVAGQKTPALVGYTYLLCALFAAVLSLLFGLLAGVWSPTLRFLSEQPLFLSLFVGLSVAWCIFALQDSVLTGLRQTHWIVVENVTFAVLKIVLLLIFATVSPQFGILASWAVPVILTLTPLNLLIARHLIPRHMSATAGQEAQVTVAQTARYVAGNYPAWLFYLASTTLLPIMVADQLGTRANAFFYLPWTIATSLYLVALNMMVSLTVEAAADQTRLTLYCYRALVQSLRLVVPLVVTLLLGAPYILLVFGLEYARESTGLLQILALAAIPNTLIALYIAYARVLNQWWAVISVQGVVCILALGLSFTLLRFGIIGVGIAWLTAQTVVAAFVSLSQLYSALRAGRALHILTYRQVD